MAVEILIAVTLVVGMCVLIWRANVGRGSDQNRIHQWADEKGYAVLRIRRSWTNLRFFRLVLPGAIWFLPRDYEVEVQDDMGGWFTVMVTIKGSRHFEARRL